MKRVQKFDLSKYSEGWEGSYIEYYTASLSDSKVYKSKLDAMEFKIQKGLESAGNTGVIEDIYLEVAESVFKLVKDTVKKYFIGGKVNEDGQVRDITKKDLEDLDEQVMQDLLSSILSGQKKT